MNTEQILESECQSIVDAFYSYLISDSDGEILSKVIRDLFINAGITDWKDVAFILDGIEEKYFPDDTYFRSEQYENKFYQIIPIGEIEIEKDMIDKDCLDEWYVDKELAYYTLSAVTIVYDIDKIKEAISDYLS